MNGRRWAQRAGRGTMSCPISGDSNTISTATVRCTATLVQFRSGGNPKARGRVSRGQPATRSRASGLPYIFDQNGEDFEPAWFPITINNDGRRASTATSYLTWDVRRRPNLAIIPDTEVMDLRIEGHRVTGVDVRRGGAYRDTIAANNVILAMGAIHTPAMLLRAGIGPGDHLQELGMTVHSDLAGVGRNLQEHPQIAVSALLRKDARQPWSTRRHIFAGFRYSSGLEGCDPVDMYGVVVNRGGWHALGQKMGGFLIWVNKAYSQGWVELTTPEAGVEPHVELNLLSDERDRLRVADALKRMAQLYRHPGLQSSVYAPFPTSYTEKSRDQAVVTVANRARMEPLARLADGPAPIRRRVLQDRVTGGLSLFDLVQNEHDLDAFVRERTHGTWHCCGTAKMGAASDPTAVTDPDGRVYGVEGLWVGDTSLMPSVPRGNTNLPAIMIGEKIADHVLKARG